jgi:hypothetical protein
VHKNWPQAHHTNQTSFLKREIEIMGWLPQNKKGLLYFIFGVQIKGLQIKDRNNQ